MRTLLDRSTFSSRTNGQVAGSTSSDWAYYQKALIQHRIQYMFRVLAPTHGSVSARLPALSVHVVNASR